MVNQRTEGFAVAAARAGAFAGGLEPIDGEQHHQTIGVSRPPALQEPACRCIRTSAHDPQDHRL
jgi:hypothetical protein